MATLKEMETRLAVVEALLERALQHNAELEAQIAASRPPAPKPEPRFRDDRTLPGVGGKVDQMGNRIVGPAPDAKDTTVGGSFHFGSASGPAIKPLGAGRFRYPDGIIRNGAGEAVVLSSAAPDEPIVSPRRSPQHQQSIDILDRMLPIAPRQPPDDAA
jgi:hypothetical protein